MNKTLAIKIDVDTDRGTRLGVPRLLNLFDRLNIPATFLFSLGPDNTGKAIKRIFRPGFLKKVSRSSVVSLYGIRTLLNGTLLPAPHIGKRNKPVMQSTYKAGHEVGIHCYDHIRWQDGLNAMSQNEVDLEFKKARTEFESIFGFKAKTAGAAGWQANEKSLSVYDASNLLYASDARGTAPFFPKIGDTVFNTLQIPTTLPTLDELIGRPEYPIDALTTLYLHKIKNNPFNTFTAHAEIEGMKYLDWFETFLRKALSEGIQFVKVEDLAMTALNQKDKPSIANLIQGTVDGRSGTLALQD